MQQATKIFRLKGIIQHYNWGGKRFLPELIGEKTNNDQPYAEYWMGAHVKAPSLIQFPNGENQSLDIFLKSGTEEKLGSKIAGQFGRLPYLFKVLDVQDMLSIQVHPSKEAAIKEFAKEENSGIPITAANRNYKDDNHKPELMLAISEFYLLHGFKAPAQLKYQLTTVTELGFLLKAWDAHGYEGIYKAVMEMPETKVDEILAPLIKRVLPLYEKGKLHKWQEDFWAARAYKTFCTEGHFDRGLFSIYFFNIVKLEPGQAIFQDAGLPHAYLEGQNLEIMANSDNVLRGGLTNKHIDVQELLKHIRFEPTYPAPIEGQQVGEEIVYSTPAIDFELRKLEIDRLPKQVQIRSTDIFFLMDGIVEASQGETIIKLHKGECLLAVSGATVVFSSDAEATIYHATVPD